MNYSPIKTWRIKNFRNLGDITIDFTKSPIIALIGENEAGKTSVVKTFDVLGYNGNPMEQKDYIRNGTTGFGIAATLVDGTTILRMKTNSSNTYAVERDGKNLYTTNKLDNGEVPPIVQEIMGMIIEPETKEPLHVRTYENQLLFVLTKPSENYKVMYNALKVENLIKAIKEGSDEANKLKSEIKSNEISIDTLNRSLRGIRILDIEPAVLVKERLKAELSQLEKLEKALELIERNKELTKTLGALAELKNVEEINVNIVSKFVRYNIMKENLNRMMRNAEKFNSLKSLEMIDLSTEQKLIAVKRYINRNSELERIKSKYEGLEGIEEINTRQLASIKRCLELINKNSQLAKASERYTAQELIPIDDKEVKLIRDAERVLELLRLNTQKEQEMDEAKQKAHELQHEIIKCGAVVGKCPKCNTDVIMEMPEKIV